MKRWVLWLLLLAIGGGGGALLVRMHFHHYMDTAVDPEGGRVRVTIPAGTDMVMVVEILSQEEVVRLPLYFRLAALATG
ncbi:MAG: hypothetical protein FJ098_08145, partial [Deltaproteobacteria bacterium]|nr:hypothetical protein [Deltaproteobacteria bacterium]